MITPEMAADFRAKVDPGFYYTDIVLAAAEKDEETARLVRKFLETEDEEARAWVFLDLGKRMGSRPDLWK